MDSKKMRTHQMNNIEKEQTTQDWLSSFNHLEQQLEEFEKRINFLEDSASLDKIRQNRIILCGIVKDARIKILECNDLCIPTAKDNWHNVLNSLSRSQLVKAKISLQCWPKMKEILAPSTVMLNEWVNGTLQGDLESIINDMSANNQILWKELCRIVNLDFAQEKPMEDSTTRLSRVGSFRNCRHD